MLDSVNDDLISVNLEQYPVIPDSEPIFRGEIRQPLHIAPKIVPQKLDFFDDRFESFSGNFLPVFQSPWLYFNFITHRRSEGREKALRLIYDL